MEEDELYRDHILDHYDDPYHRGNCPGATHAHEDDNPLCGDVVRIELQVDPERRIRQAYFSGDGCRISQAAASMLVERMDGKPVAEAQVFSAADMLKLFGAKLTPNRQKCCLLSWRVLQGAIYSPLDGGGDAAVRNPDGPSRPPPHTAADIEASKDKSGRDGPG